MPGLIVTTVVVPLAFGLVLGALLSAMQRRVWAGWLLTALVIVAIYGLLEGVPPLPPISSKHKLGYVLVALSVLAVLVARIPGRVRFIAIAAALVAAISWIGSNKLFGASGLQDMWWLLPFALLLAIGSTLSARPIDLSENLSPVRIGLLVAMIASAVVAMIGGFVGMGQMMGALAAATGGTLVVAYALLLARPDRTVAATSPAIELTLGLSLAAMILITACFAPSPDPLAVAVAALPTLIHLLPLPSRIDLRVKPILSGLACAVPAVAAIAVAYANSISTLP